MGNEYFSDQIFEEDLQNIKLDTPEPKGDVVLIIDDDKWIHRVLKHYFKQMELMSMSAFDCYDGIAMAIHQKPLLIMLDIVMPEVHGDKLLKMLKRVETTRNIPVIVISGHINKEIFSTAYKHGAAGFITKPINQDMLYEKMYQVLGKAFFQSRNLPEPKELSQKDDQ